MTLDIIFGLTATNEQIECGYVRIPVAPKSNPLPVDPKLIDKR